MSSPRGDTWPAMAAASRPERLPFAHTGLKSVVDIGPMILNKTITQHGSCGENLGENLGISQGAKVNFREIMPS